MLIPKIIRERYPDLDESEVEELRQHVVVDSVIKNGEVKEVGDKRFVLMAEKFVNIDDINIDLIDSVNPFQRAFEILSKSVTKQVLQVIQDAIDTTRIEITEDEARSSGRRSTLFVKSTAASARASAPTIRWSSAWPRRCSSCSASVREQTAVVTVERETLAPDARGGRVRPARACPQGARR